MRLLEQDFAGSREEYISHSLYNHQYDFSADSSLSFGSLSNKQQADVTEYLLSFSDCLCDEKPMTSLPLPENVEEFFNLTIELPATCLTDSTTFEIEAGNIQHGEEVYAELGCYGCHGTIDTPHSTVLGPWLGNIAQDGGTRIENTSAWQYVYDSILYPNDFIAPECPHTKGGCLDPKFNARRLSYSYRSRPPKFSRFIGIFNE